MAQQLDLFMCSFTQQNFQDSLEKEQTLQAELDQVEHELHKLKRKGVFRGRSELERRRDRMTMDVLYEQYRRAIMPMSNDWSDLHIQPNIKEAAMRLLPLRNHKEK